MLRFPIADTGVTVSAVGLGTVKLGRDQGVKYPTSFRIPDDREATALLNLARDLHINLIDTAPAYGASEQRLGQLLRGQRQHWVICTKVGEEFEQGQSSFDFSPEHVRFSLERSLQRLGTDYLDIVLVHSDGNDLDIIERQGTLEALAEARKRGLVRAIGMSTKTLEGGIATLKRADLVMATYNLEHKEEEPVLDFAQAQGKGVFVKKALASGHICKNQQDDPVMASMDFIFRHPGVTSTIIGTINPDHLRHNVAAVERALARHRQGRT